MAKSLAFFSLRPFIMIGIFAFNKAFAIRLPKLPYAPRIRILCIFCHHFKAVSYTHLDVYKRQGWGSDHDPNLKILDYSDLKSKNVQKDLRETDREIIVRIGGNMEKYIWTINGQSGENIPPINLKYGERVKLIFINESMMAHPMHLHCLLYTSRCV